MNSTCEGHLSNCVAEFIGKFIIDLYVISVQISDHLVVMRKGRYPVALNQIASSSATKTYVEDLQVPSDSQMYVITIGNSSSGRISLNGHCCKSTK
jgi:hypothetical protein